MSAAIDAMLAKRASLEDAIRMELRKEFLKAGLKPTEIDTILVLVKSRSAATVVERFPKALPFWDALEALGE